MSDIVEIKGIEYMFYDPKFVPAVFGMNNPGVLCWLVSLLQGLMSCPSFNKMMIKFKDDFIERRNQLGMKYVEVIEKLLSGEKDISSFSGFSETIRNAFVMEIYKKHKTIDLYSQEGASNAFVILLELLGIEDIYSIFNNKVQRDIKCEKCKKTVSSMDDKSCIIPIYCNKRKFTTSEDFSRYIRGHTTLLDKYTCDECKTTMTNIRRYEILRMLREVMVVSFNKLQLRENRWFPQELTFPQTPSIFLKYKLVANILHGGILNSRTYQSGGHYWANCLRGGKFYLCNDSSITESKYDPDPDTHLLIYHLYDAVEIDGNGIEKSLLPTP
jgi:uncharacterized UBP type Zn finger protein